MDSGALHEFDALVHLKLLATLRASHAVLGVGSTERDRGPGTGLGVSLVLAGRRRGSPKYRKLKISYPHGYCRPNE